MHIATALKTTKVCTTATFRGFRAFPPLIRKELFFRSSENQRQIPEDGLAVSMAAVLFLQGCAAFLAGTAAGAAAGYMLHDKDYNVRSPIHHEHESKSKRD